MVPRLTKIMATLGPVTGRRATICQLVDAGVNLFRLNLPHGSHEEAGRWIQWIREVERERVHRRRRQYRRQPAITPLARRGNWLMVNGKR